MKINLMYVIKNSNGTWIIYGPEYYNGNIKIFRTGYVLSSESDCIDKMDDMIVSLSPVISNVSETGVSQFDDFSIRFSEGEINVSSVPDYTNILSSINTNLSNLNTNLNSNFSDLNKSFKLPFNANFEEKIIRYFGFIYVYNNHFDYCYLNRNGVYIVVTIPHTYSSIQDIINNKGVIANDYKNRIPQSTGFKKISSFINVNYNVNPNSQSIDYTVLVLTGCNFVYDELVNFSDNKNISEILNDKDTVLLIDGQQEFKLRKDDE